MTVNPYGRRKKRRSRATTMQSTFADAPPRREYKSRKNQRSATLWIDEGLHRRVKVLASLRGVSMSAVIHDALYLYLDNLPDDEAGTVQSAG